MVDLAPDSMGGIDAVAMFRVDELSDAAPLPGRGANDVRNDAGEPPSASDAELKTGRHEPDGELDDFELFYADGGTAPAESPKRRFLHRRGRGESRIADQVLADAVAATSADVWAAHREEASSDAHPPVFDQPPTPRATEREGGTRRRQWPPALLAVATALVICLGVGVAVVPGGGGGHREKRQGLKHHASIKDTTGTRQTHALKPHTATTTSVLSSTTKPKHHKHSAKARKTTASHPSLTTPAAVLTTQTPTQTSPPVASPAPQTTSNANAGTTTAKSTTKESKKTSGATGTTSGGGLPDVQQTDQQP